MWRTRGLWRTRATRVRAAWLAACFLGPGVWAHACGHLPGARSLGCVSCRSRLTRGTLSASVLPRFLPPAADAAFSSADAQLSGCKHLSFLSANAVPVNALLPPLTCPLQTSPSPPPSCRAASASGAAMTTQMKMWCWKNLRSGRSCGWVCTAWERRLLADQLWVRMAGDPVHQGGKSGLRSRGGGSLGLACSGVISRGHSLADVSWESGEAPLVWRALGIVA